MRQFSDVREWPVFGWPLYRSMWRPSPPSDKPDPAETTETRSLLEVAQLGQWLRDYPRNLRMVVNWGDFNLRSAAVSTRQTGT
jgi:hypothetical protein